MIPLLFPTVSATSIIKIASSSYVGSNLPPTRTHFSVVVNLTSGALAPEKQVATVHERSYRRAVSYSTVPSARTRLWS